MNTWNSAQVRASPVAASGSPSPDTRTAAPTRTASGPPTPTTPAGPTPSPPPVSSCRRRAGFRSSGPHPPSPCWSQSPPPPTSAPTAGPSHAPYSAFSFTFTITVPAGYVPPAEHELPVARVDPQSRSRSAAVRNRAAAVVPHGQDTRPSPFRPTPRLPEPQLDLNGSKLPLRPRTARHRLHAELQRQRPRRNIVDLAGQPCASGASPPPSGTHRPSRPPDRACVRIIRLAGCASEITYDPAGYSASPFRNGATARWTSAPCCTISDANRSTDEVLPRRGRIYSRTGSFDPSSIAVTWY